MIISSKQMYGLFHLCNNQEVAKSWHDSLPQKSPAQSLPPPPNILVRVLCSLLLRIHGKQSLQMEEDTLKCRNGCTMDLTVLTKYVS